MRISERIKKDVEQYKKLENRTSRIAFIWDYYKIPLIILIVLSAIVLLTAVNNIGRKNIHLYAVVLNSDSSIIDCDESVFDFIMEEAGYDTGRYMTDVNDKLSLGRDNNEAADIETLQVLSALFSISDLDLYVADKQWFDYFAQNDGFADLGVLIDRGLLESNEDILYYFEDSKGRTVLGGIILEEDSVIHQAGYYHDEVYMGVVANANNFTEAVDFVTQILKDRK